MKKNLWVNIGFQSGAVVVALLITTLILLAVGAPPLAAYQSILSGAFGSSDNLIAVPCWQRSLSRLQM